MDSHTKENQRLSRPFRYMIHQFKETTEKSAEHEKVNFENRDKFILWIVGFSIAGLGFLLTDKTISFENIYLKKFIYISLTASVLCGIICRYYSFVHLQILQSNYFFFSAAFNMESYIGQNTDPIGANDNVDILVDRLKEDFNQDFNYLIEGFEIKTPEQKIEIYNELFVRLKQNIEWAVRDFENAKDYAWDTIKKGYNLSNKEMDKMLKISENSNIQPLVRKINTYSYFFCMLFFAVPLILLAILF